MKKFEKDYEEFLRLFNKHEVKYCIVGAFAVAFYAVPRYTKDMDILVEPSMENGRRIMRALKDFGFGSLKLAADDFNQEDRIIQLGYEPIRIDIITSIAGCSFQEVWTKKKKGIYGRERAFFIGLNELIKNKKKSSRKQDQTDLEILLIAKRRIGKRAI